VETAELIALLHQVRDRVRARHPESTSGAQPIPLADLMPLVHARDAALGKVAAIGSVNPRPGGPINALVQGWKKLVARVLDWHIRDQIDFNRKTIACVDAAIEALNANNRALVELGGRISAVEDVARELKDIRDHWVLWRAEWERKLQSNEVQFLRSIADLQGAFQHRVTLMDSNYRDTVRGQHRDFEALLQGLGNDIQKRLWSDLERMRLEYERLIHAELRVVRQRSELGREDSTPRRGGAEEDQSPTMLPFDYARFAERFRGTEEYVKQQQEIYRADFTGRSNVLDVGCGRGEFLEMMRTAEVQARGIDSSAESVAMCRAKGLEAEQADLFAHLENLPESSLDGIFCSQVVEHLPPERLPEMIRLCASRLERNGIIAIETPNPECLAIFATHFYLDPTHTRPVPHPLLLFYLEEFGVGGLKVRRLSPAMESMPSLAALPQDFREAFFGGLDYAIVGTKL